MNDKSRDKPGPKEDHLKIEGDWKKIMGKILRKNDSGAKVGHKLPGTADKATKN